MRTNKKPRQIFIERQLFNAFRDYCPDQKDYLQAVNEASVAYRFITQMNVCRNEASKKRKL